MSPQIWKTYVFGEMIAGVAFLGFGFYRRANDMSDAGYFFMWGTVIFVIAAITAWMQSIDKERK